MKPCQFAVLQSFGSMRKSFESSYQPPISAPGAAWPARWRNGLSRASSSMERYRRCWSSNWRRNGLSSSCTSLRASSLRRGVLVAAADLPGAIEAPQAQLAAHACWMKDRRESVIQAPAPCDGASVDRVATARRRLGEQLLRVDGVEFVWPLAELAGHGDRALLREN